MIDTANDFLTQLRIITGPFHHSIEQVPLSILLLSKDVSLQHYSNYLVVLYGFVKEFEESIYPQVKYIIDDLESRKKTTLLFSDLKTIGINSEIVEPFNNNFFRQNHSVAGALGCMYVLEGSTLGGQLIRRHLEKTLGEAVAGSLTYLKAYNSNTGYMWKKFLTLFCELAVKDGQQDEAIICAIETFKLLEKWMKRQSEVLLEA